MQQQPAAENNTASPVVQQPANTGNQPPANNQQVGNSDTAAENQTPAQQQPADNQPAEAAPENNADGSGTESINIGEDTGNFGDDDYTAVNIFEDMEDIIENIVEGSFILPGDENITFIGETILVNEYTQAMVSGLNVADDGRYYFVLDGSGAPFEFSIDIEFTEFIELYMSGMFWDSGSDYAVRSGSTIITISAERLARMSMGYHTISIVFLNETVEIIFDLVKPVTTEAAASFTSSPRTDDSMIIFLFVLFFAAVKSAAAYLKKRRNYGIER